MHAKRKDVSLVRINVVHLCCFKIFSGINFRKLNKDYSFKVHKFVFHDAINPN